MNKNLIILAIGSIVVATFSFIKLNQHRNKIKAAQKESKKENNERSQKKKKIKVESEL